MLLVPYDMGKNDVPEIGDLLQYWAWYLLSIKKSQAVLDDVDDLVGKIRSYFAQAFDIS